MPEQHNFATDLPENSGASGDLGASKAETWSSRSLGRRWQHQFFYTLLHFFGLKPGKIVLWFVVLFYSLNPVIAGRAAPYLKHRFGHAGAARRFQQVFRLYWNFGSVLLERAAARILGKYSISSKMDILQALLDEGSGLILLGAHVGAWQIAISGLKCGKKINIVQPRVGRDVDLHIFEHTSQGSVDVNFIDPADGIGSFVEIRAALQRGEIVCLMGDRVSPGEKLTVPVDFLGGQALFPASVFMLASITKSPIAVCFSRRVGECAVECALSMIMRIPQGLKKNEKSLHQYVYAFAQKLELYTQENPYQFFNFYDFWIN